MPLTTPPTDCSRYRTTFSYRSVLEELNGFILRPGGSQTMRHMYLPKATARFLPRWSWPTVTLRGRSQTPQVATRQTDDPQLEIKRTVATRQAKSWLRDGRAYWSSQQNDYLLRVSWRFHVIYLPLAGPR